MDFRTFFTLWQCWKRCEMGGWRKCSRYNFGLGHCLNWQFLCLKRIIKIWCAKNSFVVLRLCLRYTLLWWVVLRLCLRFKLLWWVELKCFFVLNRPLWFTMVYANASQPVGSVTQISFRRLQNISKCCNIPVFSSNISWKISDFLLIRSGYLMMSNEQAQVFHKQ